MTSIKTSMTSLVASFARASDMQKRLLRSGHVIFRDLTAPASAPDYWDSVHLEAVLRWMMRAQDVRESEDDRGGVSAGWTFKDGWLPSYPETSGYIVETWLSARRVVQDELLREELLARTQKILDWELSLQRADGSFPGHFNEPTSSPVVFNTGQIMHGMIAGHLELGRADCLEAATRAGRWLVQIQDDDGCWRKHTHNGIPHTYNTRAAWALVRAGILAGDTKLARAATANIAWAKTQVRPSGWFAQNAFTTDAAPFTHTIAYAARGFLETGLLTNDDEAVNIAARVARELARLQHESGWLDGAFADDWKSASSSCCLTGLAQTALVWLRLAQAGVESSWAPAVERALRFLKQNHVITGSGAPEDGAIAGSTPIWGRYSRFEFPNWAAKFFADLLLMSMSEEIVPRPLSPTQM